MTITVQQEPLYTELRTKPPYIELCVELRAELCVEFRAEPLYAELCTKLYVKLYIEFYAELKQANRPFGGAFCLTSWGPMR